MPSGKAVQPLVYVDSCVYLDLVTRNRDPHADTGKERWTSAKEVFDAVTGETFRIVYWAHAPSAFHEYAGPRAAQTTMWEVRT